MSIFDDRLVRLDDIHLDEGKHKSFEEGHCAMEVVSWLANQGFTDAPSCTSPILGLYTVKLNDWLGDVARQSLIPFLPRTIGSAGDGQDSARAYLALDWLVRTYTPTWLDLAGLTTDAGALRELRPIVDLVTAGDAGLAFQVARGSARAARGASGVTFEIDAAGAVSGAVIETTWKAIHESAGSAAAITAGHAPGGLLGSLSRKPAATTACAPARDAAWAAVRSDDEDEIAESFRPTVKALQDSALDLFDRMIDPSRERATKITAKEPQ